MLTQNNQPRVAKSDKRIVIVCLILGLVAVIYASLLRDKPVVITEKKEVKKTVPDKMVLVEGGTFNMGSNTGQPAEKPIHNVKLKDFYIAKYEVTQKEWMEIMGSNPSNSFGENKPVENITWNEVQTFISKLNLKTGEKYRLPTEARDPGMIRILEKLTDNKEEQYDNSEG